MALHEQKPHFANIKYVLQNHYFFSTKMDSFLTAIGQLLFGKRK